MSNFIAYSTTCFSIKFHGDEVEKLILIINEEIFKQINVLTIELEAEKIKITCF
jgi:hypothetical protein